MIDSVKILNNIARIKDENSRNLQIDLILDDETVHENIKIILRNSKEWDISISCYEFLNVDNNYCKLKYISKDFPNCIGYSYISRIKENMHFYAIKN